MKSEIASLSSGTIALILMVLFPSSVNLSAMYLPLLSTVGSAVALSLTKRKVAQMSANLWERGVCWT